MAESSKTIKLVNLFNETINFDQYLNSSNSLLIKNCKNLKIFLSTKINKITIENSNHLFLMVDKLIIGFEISKSKYILIKQTDKKELSIPFISLFKSQIFLVGNIDVFLNTIVSSENSDVYNVNIVE